MNLLLKALNQKEELKTPDGYDKHIHCEGSREHVLSYSTKGTHCSHKNCVVNRDNQSSTRDWIFSKQEERKPNRLSQTIARKVVDLRLNQKE